jgi:hypothetical protein
MNGSDLRLLASRVQSALTTTALLAGLAIAGVLGADAASASPARACALDRPCLDQFFYAPTTGRLNATWTASSPGYDFFNVRWMVNRGGRVESFGQHEVRGTVAKLGVRPADRIHPFTVSVQGCRTRFLAPSKCSPWASSTRIPVPAPR